MGNEDPDPVRWKLKNLINKLGFLPLEKTWLLTTVY
jgi:hypothetical protein